MSYKTVSKQYVVQIIIKKVNQELSYMQTATIDLSFYCKESEKEIFLNFQLLANKDSKGDPSDFLYHLHKPGQYVLLIESDSFINVASLYSNCSYVECACGTLAKMCKKGVDINPTKLQVQQFFVHDFWTIVLRGGNRYHKSRT